MTLRYYKRDSFFVKPYHQDGYQYVQYSCAVKICTSCPWCSSHRVTLTFRSRCHVSIHLAPARTCSLPQPPIKLLQIKLGMFFFISHPSRYCSGSSGGLLALKPAWLIPDDTAATPSAVSSLHHSGKTWVGKRRREKQSWWRLGRRLAYEAEALLKMAAVKRCDAEVDRARSRSPPSPRPPPILTDGPVCLKTLSHALDTPGHQIKCRQASLSSWVRRYVCAWTQVWLLR